MNDRYWRKLHKYIEDNELAKFKSYIKRRSVDVTGLLDVHGNSLLHISCKYGSEVILRYLLKNKADVLLKNKAGDLPIHLACKYAQLGHKYGETDLVLPLVKADHACLDVTDARGVTARHMLQRFKQRAKPRRSSRQHVSQSMLQGDVPSSSYSDTESDSFEEKLARELEDECGTERGGIYDEDSYSYEQEYETWNTWADRMAREYAAAQSQSASYHQQSRRRPPTAGGSAGSAIPKISARKRKLFEQNIAAANEQQRRTAEQHRIAMIGLTKLQYERDCIALYEPGSTAPIGYNEIPWPQVAGKELPLKDAVTQFLFGDLETGSETFKSYLRVQRIRWHPDRFLHRCSGRLKASDRQKILDKVIAVSQILNGIHASLPVRD